MKNIKQFQKNISQEIKLASNLQRVKFGFDICKRLFSEYKRIAEQNYLPDIEILSKSIDFTDTYLNFNTLDQDKILTLLDEVDLIRPITDGLSESEATTALNTITAFSELLLYLAEEDYNHICTISELMIKCTESKILDSNDQISFEEVDSHPLIFEEFKQQKGLINNYA